MFLDKVVLPVAGVGTRLLPVTKEQPKEMLPIFSSGTDGKIRVFPLIQVVFEQLYSLNFRKFCFIIGKKEGIIKEHFTPNETLMKLLENKNNNNFVKDLLKFQNKVRKSKISWIKQPRPLGFGHAVLKSLPFTKNDRFLLHAGDTIILSKNNSHINKLIQCHRTNKASASFIVYEIKNPRQYGVIDGKVRGNVIEVTDLEEKPKKPKTNLAILPVYIFEPEIFQFIEKKPADKYSEIQLTTAIEKMMNSGLRICALNLTKEISHLDIGNPQSYWHSLTTSFQAS